MSPGQGALSCFLGTDQRHGLSPTPLLTSTMIILPSFSIPMSSKQVNGKGFQLTRTFSCFSHIFPFHLVCTLSNPLPILKWTMRSSIKGVRALPFPRQEWEAQCSTFAPNPALSPSLPHLHPFSYPFFPIWWICPAFSLVPERLWSLSPFASFHEENEEGLYRPIMGHLQSWPRKNWLCLSLGGKKEIPVTFQGEEDIYPSLWSWLLPSPPGETTFVWLHMKPHDDLQEFACILKTCGTLSP